MVPEIYSLTRSGAPLTAITPLAFSAFSLMLFSLYRYFRKALASSGFLAFAGITICSTWVSAITLPSVPREGTPRKPNWKPSSRGASFISSSNQVPFGMNRDLPCRKAVWDWVWLSATVPFISALSSVAMVSSSPHTLA
ncbi:hypothetical protein D3C75_956380 [compost metagenome]